MRKWIAFSTIALLAFAAPAAAQTFGFGAHAGVSLPMGSYGSTDDFDEDGFAKLGFSAGLDLWYPLTAVTGLSWYTSAEVAAHSIDEDELGVEVDGGYLLVPLMTGVRFDIPLGAMALFATGQAGVVFNKGPDFSDPVFGDFNAEWGTDFGFALGAGVQATENVYAGLKFYPLDIELAYEDAETTSESMSYLDIFIGFGVH